MCPVEDSTQLFVLVGTAFLSLAFGATALAPSFTAVRRAGGGGIGALGRILLGFAAAALVAAPFAMIIVVGVCGLS